MYVISFFLLLLFFSSDFFLRNLICCDWSLARSITMDGFVLVAMPIVEDLLERVVLSFFQ